MEGFFDKSKEITSGIRIAQGEISDYKKELRRHEQIEKILFQQTQEQRELQVSLLESFQSTCLINEQMNCALQQYGPFLEILKEKESAIWKNLQKLRLERGPMILEMRDISKHSGDNPLSPQLEEMEKNLVQLTQQVFESRELLLLKQQEHENQVACLIEAREENQTALDEFEAKVVQVAALKKRKAELEDQMEKAIEKRKSDRKPLETKVEKLEQNLAELKDWKILLERLRNEVQTQELERERLLGELESLKPMIFRKKQKQMTEEEKKREQGIIEEDEIVYW